MLAQVIVGFDLPHWETWTAPVVGLGSAGLMLALATGFARRRKPAAPAPTSAPPAPLVPSTPGPERVPLNLGRQEPFELGAADRRSCVRRIGKIIKVLVSDSQADGQPFEGWICDRSLTGLRIGVSQAVDVNRILSVRPLEAAADTDWVQVEVKRCEAQDDHWELGCQFVRTPPYSQLLLFG